jgi:hypothetical protein
LLLAQSESKEVQEELLKGIEEESRGGINYKLLSV